MDNTYRRLYAKFQRRTVACIFLAGCGRLWSIRKVGIPAPRAVWRGYLVPELLIPIVIATADPSAERCQELSCPGSDRVSKRSAK